MEFRLLGGSGFKVPVLSFGTATFGGGNEFFRAWGSTGVEEARRLVDVCLEAGANMFDTADAYSDGLAEEILGKAIAGRRGEVILSTKGSARMGPGPNDVGSSRYHLIRACEASLRRLGTDHVELYLLHGFDALTPVEETLRALDDLVRSGKVCYVGCCNFSGWHLMKSLAVAERYGLPRHVAHQASYSLAARDYEWELMPLALDQNVGTLVWGALAGSLLSGKVRRNAPRPKDSRASVDLGRPEIPAEQLYAIVDVLADVAAETGKTVPQIAINWVLQRPTVTSVVIGARNEEQLRQNLGAAGWRLTPEHVARLDAASARTPVYPYWHQRLVRPDRNPPPTG